MSSTRHAGEGSAFRQERYCSSAEFEAGLMANLVAKRCKVLEAADRELIWWLQLQSHRGGLEKLAPDIVARWPERCATNAMQRFGISGTYSSEQVNAVRREIPDDWLPMQLSRGWESMARQAEICRHLRLGREPELAETGPSSHPAATFVQVCRSAAAEGMSTWLKNLCLDPSLRPAQARPWYFPELVETLRQYQKAESERLMATTIVTEIGEQVYETLEFCQQERCLGLVNGNSRIGKTYAAMRWCDLNPGRARYAQVPSTSDDIGFFRAIAQSLGVSINQNSKAQHLRCRIEEVLQAGDLLLVLDEAHYLWPQSNYRDALPGRINWVNTALVNKGVPVALVTTPQFWRSLKSVERKTAWTSEQFKGRLGVHRELPSQPSLKDLEAVARALLPEGSDRAIKYLVNYGVASKRYLAGIEAAVKHARFLAKRGGLSADVVGRAIKSSALPGDVAIEEALGTEKTPVTDFPARHREGVGLAGALAING